MKRIEKPRRESEQARRAHEHAVACLTSLKAEYTRGGDGSQSGPSCDSAMAELERVRGRWPNEELSRAWYVWSL